MQLLKALAIVPLAGRFKMKKLFLLIIIIIIAVFPVAGFINNPIFVNDVWPHIFVGPMVVEYALGADSETIELLQPFAVNGILHFVGLAIPVSRGPFGQVFEFDLDFLEDTPRILGQFRGILEGRFRPEHFQDGILVSGFATAGQIVITRVFFCDEEADRWLDTVRLAF